MLKSRRRALTSLNRPATVRWWVASQHRHLAAYSHTMYVVCADRTETRRSTTQHSIQPSVPSTPASNPPSGQHQGQTAPPLLGSSMVHDRPLA
ncbi:hypothetical protein CMUS01_08966 [Colletotrichum musicola]|uniref:Uncharacterized protein n=1 Tax=Colletotrichum musicola TaxID=2175873 RepID=A0A8H6KAM5_9PEZI|nr:hypothetical protein CMUS01_08966 [Colletotrichum musicola]